VSYLPNSIAGRDVASLAHMQTNLRKHQQEGSLVIALERALDDVADEFAREGALR
jgi:hypothetical protein